MLKPARQASPAHPANTNRKMITLKAPNYLCCSCNLLNLHMGLDLYSSDICRCGLTQKIYNMHIQSTEFHRKLMKYIIKCSKSHTKILTYTKGCNMTHSHKLQTFYITFYMNMFFFLVMYTFYIKNIRT